MKVIDFHTHVFPPNIIEARESYLDRDRWFGWLYADSRARMASVEELLASMDAAHVDMAVVFGFAFADLALCIACKDYVLDQARRHSDRLIPFALLNPSAGRPALLEARRCLELGAMGIGELMPDGQGFDLTDFSLLNPLMDLAREDGVPLMIHVNELVGHVYPGKGTQGPEHAYGLATHYPDNVLVLSHWGGGLPFYELMPEARTVLSKVYYDTAASLYLYRQTIFSRVMSWAPAKVLWGTDYPLVSHRRSLAHVESAGLEEDDLSRLLAGNASVALGWPDVQDSKGA